MLRLSRNKVFIFLFIIIFLKPSNVTYWPVINSVYKVLKLFIAVILLLDFFRNDVKIKRDDFLFLSVLFIWLVSTYRNLHSFGDNLQQVLSIICLQILMKKITSRDEILYFFRIISCVAKIYILLELITIFLGHPLFADAMGRTDKYFLGNDNYSAFVIIPLCGLMMAYSLLTKNKIDRSTWFYIIIAFLCFLAPGSVAATVASSIFIVMAIFINGSLLRKMFNLRNVIYAAIIFVTLVVCFNIQNHFGSLLSFIGKNALNSREIIWPKAVALISQRPLFGWGAMSEEQIEGYLLHGTTHAHNIILQLLLDIGIVGSLIFAVWVYKVLKKNASVKKKYMYILQVCITCYVFDAIFDFYFGLVYFWLILFSFDLISKYEIENININKGNV